MEDLVNKDIYHPPDDHEDYACRVSYSKGVANWIVYQVQELIAVRIYNLTDKPVYADDMLAAIRSLVIRDSKLIIKRISLKIFNIYHSQFTKIKEFVYEFRDMYLTLKRLKLAMTPYLMIICLLNKIESELPNWVPLVEQDITKCQDKLVKSDFLNMCTKVMEKSHDLHKEQSFAHTAITKAPKKVKESSKKTKNWPPRGVSWEEHCNNLREASPRSVTSKCGYCKVIERPVSI